MKKFEFLGGALCLDFLNTVHDAGAKDPGEELSSAADLAAWGVQARIVSVREAGRLQVGRLRDCVQFKPLGGKRASLLDDVRALRESLRQVFRRAARHGKVAPRDIEILNLLLGRFPVAGRIERSNGGWTMTWKSQAGGWRKIAYAVVKSAGELIATGRWRAVRECASMTCTWMFLDSSKNHSRRWCEMARCGNREKVHRFRARSRRARLLRASRLSRRGQP